MLVKIFINYKIKFLLQFLWVIGFQNYNLSITLIGRYYYELVAIGNIFIRWFAAEFAGEYPLLFMAVLNKYSLYHRLN